MNIAIKEITNHLAGIKFDNDYFVTYQTKNNILQNNKIKFSYNTYSIIIRNINYLYHHSQIKNLSFDDILISLYYGNTKVYQCAKNKINYIKYDDRNLKLLDNFNNKDWDIRIETIESKNFLFIQNEIKREDCKSKEKIILQQQLPCLIDEILTKTVICNNVKLIISYMINKEDNTTYKLVSFYLQFEENVYIFYELKQLTLNNDNYQAIFNFNNDAFWLTKLFINNKAIGNDVYLFINLSKLPIRCKSFHNYQKFYDSILQFNIALHNEQLRFVNL